MKCEGIENQIEDYLYGELSTGRAAKLRAHLADCPSCAALRDRLERENELFATFYEETQLEPTGEMWEAIRARLDAPPGRAGTASNPGRFFGWLLRPAVLWQAAFALLLIALSVAATLYFTRHGRNDKETIVSVTQTPSPQPAVTPVSDTASPIPGPATPSEVHGTEHGIRPVRKETSPPAPRRSEPELIARQIARAEREYRSAIQLLDSAIAKRRNNISPDVLREYEASLALIETAISRSHRAMQQRPGDLAAGQFLLAAYAKKVELMQDLAMR